MKLFLKILPVILFIGLSLFLWKGLSLHPQELSSPFINKTIPAVDLPDLYKIHQPLTSADFQGHMSLLNVFATWCINCHLEHPVLMDIKREYPISIYGLNYKDDPQKVKKWLAKAGNPYQKIGVDSTGNTAINLGVYGTPETFLIDKTGVIRYKYIGPVTTEVWQNTLLPQIKKWDNK